MVIFAVTRNGFIELEPILSTGLYPVWVWVGDGVLDENEIDSLRSRNVDITKFNYEISPEDRKSLDGALSTIAEHHPGERVWIECQPII